MLLLLTVLKELSLLIEDSELKLLTLLRLLLEDIELSDELDEDELLESLLSPSLFP